MMWNSFALFALAALICWITAIAIGHKSGKKILTGTIYFLGCLAIVVFIVLLWISLDRPPLRTLGETRLWYSLFVPLIGLAIYARWGFKWILSYSTFLALVFILINVLKPDTHNKALMPALQSIWFIPHVIVYIFSYALLGASSLVALFAIYRSRKQDRLGGFVYVADNLVYIGFSFLTMGLIFGAFWAKEAWGHYWTWDPKETWAFITWLGYLVYIHFRHAHSKKEVASMLMLSLAFIFLLICWFGISYLPSAQNSVHVYNG